MCDEKIWKFQIKELKKKYKVIFAKVKKGETIKEYSSNIIKSLPKKFSIIGFSMGGFIALDLSINHPERVEKLILVGTNGRSISDKRKKFLNKLRSPRQGLRPPARHSPSRRAARCRR